MSGASERNRSVMLFEDNLAVVHRHRPALAAILAEARPCGEVLTSRAGFPTLKADVAGGQPVYLHSSYDPWREAARLTGDFQLMPGDTMLVLGLGLGYHVWELARRYPRVDIIAVDPHPGFFLRAMETLDLTTYLTQENLTLVFSHDVLEVGGLIAHRVDLTTRTQVKTYVYPPVARLYPEEFAELQKALFEGLVQTVLKRNTALFFARPWTENFLTNLEAAWGSQGINALFGAFTGVPAVIVSAGPSLDKNMHLLDEIRDKAVILAAGTSFKPLLRAGLKPDMVVSIDGGEANGTNFAGVDEDETALVFDPVVHSSIPPRFRGPIFAGCGQPHFHLFVDSVLGLDKGFFPINGYSVALTCLGLALAMGCDPIVFIGQDLALKDGRSHVRGSIYDEIDKTAPQEKLFEVEGNYEEKVWTDTALLSILRNLETEIAAVEDGRTFINATEGGARIRGTKIMTLRETIDAYAGKDVHIREKIREIFGRHDPARDYDKMLENMRGVDRDLLELVTVAAEGGRLARRLKSLYAHGLPDPKPLAKVKKGFAKVDSRILGKWQANLLLQRAVYPVHVATFADNADRHENMSEQEQGKMVAAQSETFYEGLKETTERTENMVREVISQIEKISSSKAG